jgi:hypothetical protein
MAADGAEAGGPVGACGAADTAAQPSSLEQQPAATSGLADDAAKAFLQRLQHAIDQGIKLGEAELQPSVAAWSKEADKRVAKATAACDHAAAMHGPAEACRRDAVMLKAAIAQLSPDQQAQRATLQAALDGVLNFSDKGMAPQVSMLISNRSGGWGAMLSPGLSQDPVVARIFQLLTRAFKQSMAQGQLQRAAARLHCDTEEEAGRLAGDAAAEELQIPVPAVRAAAVVKPPPRSKQLRNELRTTIYPWLVPILQAAGQAALSLTVCRVPAEACQGS